MTKSGLTKKNMSNKHFQKTEQAIFLTFYKLRDYPSAKLIAKKAGVSRSTFYRHHQSAYSIPGDYEKYLLTMYDNAIRGLLHKDDVALKVLFLRTFVFIANYKGILTKLFTEGHKEIIKRMVRRLKPRVTNSWLLAIDKDQAFTIFENEFLGIVEIWSKQGFPISELNSLLIKTLYLTRTAPEHLAPVTRRDAKLTATLADPKSP